MIERNGFRSTNSSAAIALERGASSRSERTDNPLHLIAMLVLMESCETKPTVRRKRAVMRMAVGCGGLRAADIFREDAGKIAKEVAVVVQHSQARATVRNRRGRVDFAPRALPVAEMNDNLGIRRANLDQMLQNHLGRPVAPAPDLHPSA